MRIHKVAEISHPRSSVFSRRFVNTECRNHQSRRCATFQGIRHHPCTHNVHDDSGARYRLSWTSYLHAICKCIRTTASIFNFSVDRACIRSGGGHSNVFRQTYGRTGIYWAGTLSCCRNRCGDGRWSLLWSPARESDGSIHTLVDKRFSPRAHCRLEIFLTVPGPHADLLHIYRSVDISQEIGTGDGASGRARWSMQRHFWLSCYSCRKHYLTDPTSQHKKSSLTTRKKSKKLKTFWVHGNPTVPHVWSSKHTCVDCGFGILTDRPHVRLKQRTLSSDRWACSNTHLSSFQHFTCAYLSMVLSLHIS